MGLEGSESHRSVTPRVGSALGHSYPIKQTFTLDQTRAKNTTTEGFGPSSPEIFRLRELSQRTP